MTIVSSLLVGALFVLACVQHYRLVRMEQSLASAQTLLRIIQRQTNPPGAPNP